MVDKQLSILHIPSIKMLNETVPTDSTWPFPIHPCTERKYQHFFPQSPRSLDRSTSTPLLCYAPLASLPVFPALTNAEEGSTPCRCRLEPDVARRGAVLERRPEPTARTPVGGPPPPCNKRDRVGKHGRPCMLGVVAGGRSSGRAARWRACRPAEAAADSATSALEWWLREGSGQPCGRSSSPDTGSTAPPPRRRRICGPS
jgi:hypothetical protein